MGISVMNNWLSNRKLNPGAKFRLFCFPYAGGGPGVFRGWQARLPEVEICCVQLPGHGNQIFTPPFTHIVPLVEAVAEGLLPYLDKPFAFFGHSMGALISFELAGRLRVERGLEVAHVFVAGCRAPQFPQADRINYNLPHDEFIQELHRLKGTPKEVLEHAELLDILLPVIRADFEVCETYQPITNLPLSCPITAFGGLEDSDVTHEHLEAWREYTSSCFTLKTLPGDHFFLHTAEPALIQMIREELRGLGFAQEVT